MERISDLLVARGKRLLARKRQQLRFTGEHGPDKLLNDLEHHPHAFVLGCIMDLQIKAELAWQIPYEIQRRTRKRSSGGLATLSRAQVEKAMAHPRPLHKFVNVMADRFYVGIRRIDEVYGGDASRIWRRSPSSATIVRRFLEFKGVGPKIATMAANILVRDFKIPVRDKVSIDISVDVHVRRVFTRLGLVAPGAPSEHITYRARELNPHYPGIIDLSIWEIGRKWCHKAEPDCPSCPMRNWCPTAMAAPLTPAADASP